MSDAEKIHLLLWNIPLPANGNVTNDRTGGSEYAITLGLYRQIDRWRAELLRILNSQGGPR